MRNKYIIKDKKKLILKLKILSWQLRLHKLKNSNLFHIFEWIQVENFSDHISIFLINKMCVYDTFMIFN